MPICGSICAPKCREFSEQNVAAYAVSACRQVTRAAHTCCAGEGEREPAECGPGMAAGPAISSAAAAIGAACAGCCCCCGCCGCAGIVAGAAGFFQVSAAAGTGHAASRGRGSGALAPGRAALKVRGAVALSGKRSLLGLDSGMTPVFPRGPALGSPNQNGAHLA